VAEGRIDGTSGRKTNTTKISSTAPLRSVGITTKLACKQETERSVLIVDEEDEADVEGEHPNSKPHNQIGGFKSPKHQDEGGHHEDDDAGKDINRSSGKKNCLLGSVVWTESPYDLAI